MTENDQVMIEHARPEDAEAILTLKRDAWLDRYVNKEHGITREDIYKKLSDKDIKTATPKWAHGISNETMDSDRYTYVARLDSKLVGYTQPCIENGQRTLGAMYVLPDMHGQGIGGKLITKALEWHGQNDVYAGVVSYNDEAIGFYKHFGFEPTGKTLPYEFDKATGIKLLEEIEMIHKAQPPAPRA